MRDEDEWQVYMEAPDGGPLVPGVYENARRWPFQASGEPGLAIEGGGRGCNTLTGRFVVHEVMADGTGQLPRFAADFEEHCEGVAAALFGSIRLNSSVAVPQQTPVVGDWNGDGRTDTLWRNGSTGQNAVVFMNGIEPTGVGILPTAPDPAQRIVATGRFNGDGWPDILWENETTRQRRVWLMSGTSVSGIALLDPEPDPDWASVAAADFAESALLPVGDPNLQVVAAADFSGDGQADVLWRHRTSGADTIWFLDDSRRSGVAFLPTVPDSNWRIVGPK